MKVLHTVPRLSAESSGPTYSVPALCKSLAEAGHSIELASMSNCLSRESSSPELILLTFKELFISLPVGFSIDYLMFSLFSSSKRYELVHSHGLWLLPSLYSHLIANANSVPHIVSPRGSLDPAALRYSKLKKLVASLVFQKYVLRDCSAFHATSPQEVSCIRSLGFNQPIILSSNGIHNSSSSPIFNAVNKQIVYLGRFHPKKGIDLLINAWSMLENLFPEWSLKIYGEGSPKYTSKLEQQITSLKLQRCAIMNPVYGSEKFSVLHKSDLFVLPSHGENFGMVVAEALSVGTPVLTTYSCPWSVLNEYSCGWQTSSTVEGLVHALKHILTLPLESMYTAGANAQILAVERYSWGSAALKLSDGYNWLVNGGKKPACVY